MEDRLTSTLDGALVGLISGILVEVISHFTGGSPASSAEDVVATAVIAGAVVGWTAVDSIKQFGLIAGMMTSITAVSMMVLGALPFSLASRMISNTPIVLPAGDIASWALLWLFISGVAGLGYQTFVNILLAPASPTPVAQEISFEK